MLKTNLPVLNISDRVLFPFSELKLEITDEKIKKSLDISEKYYNGYLLFVLSVAKDNLSKIGVVAKIITNLQMPNGNNKLTLKGVERVNIVNCN